MKTIVAFEIKHSVIGKQARHATQPLKQLTSRGSKNKSTSVEKLDSCTFGMNKRRNNLHSLPFTTMAAFQEHDNQHGTDAEAQCGPSCSEIECLCTDARKFQASVQTQKRTSLLNETKKDHKTQVSKLNGPTLRMKSKLVSSLLCKRRTCMESNSERKPGNRKPEMLNAQIGQHSLEHKVALHARNSKSFTRHANQGVSKHLSTKCHTRSTHTHAQTNFEKKNHRPFNQQKIHPTLSLNRNPQS